MLQITVLYSAYTCPESDVDFYGNDLKHIPSVATWRGCYKQCKKYPGCAGWSWTSEGVTGGLIPYMCMLKDANFASGRKQLNGIYSGALTCRGK